METKTVEQLTDENARLRYEVEELRGNQGRQRPILRQATERELLVVETWAAAQRARLAIEAARGALSHLAEVSYQAGFVTVSSDAEGVNNNPMIEAENKLQLILACDALKAVHVDDGIPF